jgi:hypothetical protein
MLTDVEIDTLARAIIARILEDPRARASGIFDKVLLTEEGEFVPVYGATSYEGYGSFLCEFMPLAAVRRIIIESERLFDEFSIQLSDTESGIQVEKRLNVATSDEDRQSAIKTMAEVASLHLIESFRVRLCELLEDAVSESSIIANAALASVVAQYMKRTEAEAVEITADARPDLEQALKAANAKRRALLVRYINLLPNILAERGRGAPAKSPIQRQRERDAYLAKIETAYRKLRAAEGKKPRKINIATELGEGGINPKSGTDSRLNAFNVKLNRLGINYSDLVERIEKDYSSNS